MEKTHRKTQASTSGGGQTVTSDAPDTAALVAELVARYDTVDARQPGDVDSAQMARAWNVRRSIASERLTAQTDLVKLRVRDEGGRVLWVWRKK